MPSFVLSLLLFLSLSSVLIKSSKCLEIDRQNISNDDGQTQDREQQFFIDHIFHKYGNGGVITFEGLEHLMESLGLGKIKFDKTHNVSVHKTIDGDFKEVHDSLNLHHHEHTKVKRSLDLTEGSCLKPRELLTLYGLEPDHDVRISPSRFLKLCPAIVSQLDSRVCAVPLPRHESHSILPETTSSRWLLWTYGMGSVLIVSLCGVFGFALFPLLGKAEGQTLCSLLSSLSIGTLAGDALLHLIPHALHGFKDETNTVLKLSFIFLVLMALFVYESCIHLREKNKVAASNRKEGRELAIDGGFDMDHGISVHHGHSHSSSIVQMVLGGDFLHNLTDGMAIGAAYGQHPVTGFATTIAVLLHEVPHELGDLAILLDSGVSLQRALVFNVVSSIFSIIGAAIGLIIGEQETYAEWVYAFTAGSFLYIALVTLMPEMFKKTRTVNRMITHTTGIFLGGAIMFFIAMYEHELREIIEEVSL